MKLYTEEQVRQAFIDGMKFIAVHPLKYEQDANEYIDSLTPIQLPSDKEIERESEILYPINKGGSMWMPSRYDIDKANKQEGFLEGAKWMKEQILNENK